MSLVKIIVITIIVILSILLFGRFFISPEWLHALASPYLQSPTC